MRQRFSAWLVCGPPGHFYAGLADVASLLAHAAAARARKLRRVERPD